MSSQTIRDVLIRIAIENGQIKMNAPDFSEWIKAIDGLQEKMAGIAGGASSGGFQQVTSGARESQQVLDAVGDNINQIHQGIADSAVAFARFNEQAREAANYTNEASSGGIKIGRLGYGESVRQRAEMHTDSAVPQMRAAAIGQDFGEEEWNKVRNDIGRKARPMVREHDRESAASAQGRQGADDQSWRLRIKDAEEGVAAWSNLKKKALEESNEATSAAVAFAKGLSHIATASGVVTTDLSRVVAQIEGFVGTAKNAATVYQYVQKVREHVSSGASEGGGLKSYAVGGAGKLLAGAMKGGVPLGIAAGGAAAIGLGVYGAAKAYSSAHDMRSFYNQSMFDDAMSSASYQGRAGAMRTAGALDVANKSHDFGEVRGILRRATTLPAAESKIREYEAGELNPHFRSVYRNYATTQAQHQERLAQVRDRKEHSASKIEVLEKQLGDVETTRKSRTGAALSARDAAIQNRGEAMYESTIGFTARQAYRAVASPLSLVGLNSGVGQSGYYHAQENKVQEASKQITASNIAYQQAEADAQKQTAELQEALKAEKLKGLAGASEEAAISREMVQVAYNNLLAEKGRVQGNKESFGHASVADQNVALRLQRKHEAIEAKKAENLKAGRDEREDLPQYSAWEMQRSTFGGVADKTIREQAIAKADSSGMKFDSMEGQFQKDFDDYRKKVQEQGPTKEMEDLGNEINKLGVELNESLKNYHENTVQVLESMTHAYDQKSKELVNYKLMQRKGFSS